MTSVVPTLLYTTFVAYSYVQCLHIWATPGHRDDPQVIKSRILRIFIVTIFHSLAIPFVLTGILKTAPDVGSVWSILGLKNIFDWVNVIAVLKTLLLFVILFIGPIMDSIVNFSRLENYDSYLQLIRDLFIAPLTEELFYTSFITGSILAFKLSELSGTSSFVNYSPTAFHNVDSINIYLITTPLFFGFAHLHHALELSKRRYKPIQIFAICGFQCLYTTLFGYLTNRVFVNTGSLWCCFIAHAFCNCMGVPTLNVNGCIPYKVIYWCLLVIGLISFSNKFEQLTVQ